MPKLKPVAAVKSLNAISKPVALIIHLGLTGAASAGIYFLLSDYQHQHTQQQLNDFSKQASTIIERHSQNWQQQARLLAQQPMLRSTASLKAVVPLEGNVPPSLNYADQDLLNRTRTAPTPPEISGSESKAVVSTALAMPTGGYAIFEWPFNPLMQDLVAITPNNLQLKFAQQLSDGTSLEVIRLHSTGNDGVLNSVPLSTKGWQLAVGQVQADNKSPLWAALLSLISGLLAALVWGLRQDKKITQTVTIPSTPLDDFNPTAFPATTSKTISAPAIAAATGHIVDLSINNAENFNTPQSSTATSNNLESAGTAPANDTVNLHKSDSTQETADKATDAFDDLDLIQEEDNSFTPQPVEHEALEFNLDETLLPDGDFQFNAVQQFPAHLFRAYDIRGSIDDLRIDLISSIGRALGSQLREQDQYQVVVGYDARSSSSGYAKLIRQSLSDCGLTVVDIGMVTTPICYFAAAQYDGNGIMVTASHNPADENGVKWLIQHRSPTPDAIQQLMQRVQQANFTEGLGQVISQSFTDSYLNQLADDVLLSQPVHISIDGMNGSAGEVALAAFQAAGCEVSSLNIEANGMFPNGAPDPSNAAFLQELSNDIVISGSTLGFAFDGDGDRLVVLDSQGKVVSPDHLITLFAKICLDSNPGSDIVFDVKCSRMVSTVVTQEGGRPIMVRTGNTFLREALTNPAYQAVFAGEFSGHYFFNDQRGHGQDDGLYAALRLLEWLDVQGRTLEQVLADLPQRVSTPDLYLALEATNANELLTEFEQAASQLSDAKISTIDGIRLDFEYGFGIIRSSNTGNFLTARFDADTSDNLQVIRSTFARLLQPLDARLAQMIVE